jgi:hypothetical protein
VIDTPQSGVAPGWACQVPAGARQLGGSSGRTGRLRAPVSYRTERRRSPWEWRLWNTINIAVVAAWLLLVWLLPRSLSLVIDSLAALVFGGTQVVFGWMLLLNVSRFAERMADDSRGRHIMGRGFFINHHPFIWRLQGVIMIPFGAVLLIVGAGLLERRG